MKKKMSLENKIIYILFWAFLGFMFWAAWKGSPDDMLYLIFELL